MASILDFRSMWVYIPNLLYSINCKYVGRPLTIPSNNTQELKKAAFGLLVVLCPKKKVLSPRVYLDRRVSAEEIVRYSMVVDYIPFA